MENNSDLKESLGVINSIASNPSWFGEHAHRWPLAATPLGYAMACVEVVSKKSKEANLIYHQIIKAWDKPGIDIVYEEIISEVTLYLKQHVNIFGRGRAWQAD